MRKAFLRVIRATRTKRAMREKRAMPWKTTPPLWRFTRLPRFPRGAQKPRDKLFAVAAGALLGLRDHGRAPGQELLQRRLDVVRGDVAL
jgi:hypothetical protein